MATMQCVVDHITFQNVDNGFTVLQVHSNNGSSNYGLRGSRFGNRFRAVGTFGTVETGAALELYGFWGKHPKFGRQFTVEYYTEVLPRKLSEIEAYLSAGHVKGIGKTYAKRIVEAFGESTWDVLDFCPERLMEVKGIKEKTIEMVKQSWSQNRKLQPLMAFLCRHGASTSFAAKIFKEFGDQSIEVLEKNPYLLIERIDGIGFRRADELASKIGFPLNSPLRIRAGIDYWLESHATSTGSLYAYRHEILEGVCSEEILGLLNKDDIVDDVLNNMIADRALKCVEYDGNECIYPMPLYTAETDVAKNFLTLQMVPAKDVVDATTVDISHIEYSLGIEYNDEQKEAIRTAVNPLTKIMVLTGGPGTGKTTVTQGIISGLEYQNKKILLAAPTGRAAKRMTEATGCESKTIHKLLEYRGTGFLVNETNPLDGDVLILDECSMIDIYLMDALLKAIPKSMKLIMIGDVDQLPSVGPGCVLRNIIESEQFPVVRLTQIFRQAQTSQIICGAHDIIEGNMPDLTNKPQGDLFFISRGNADNAINTVVDLVANRLPKQYNIKPNEIQVLTPKRKGYTGCVALNAALQAQVNPGGAKITRGEVIFRKNDKVIQQKNDYERGVFNGDVGVIDSVNTHERSLTVQFENGRIVQYSSSDLSELAHAYAITIHKSQGSEYPIVVIPILKADSFMLERNLLYTGVTRAKQILVLVGTQDAIAYAVGKINSIERKSLLRQRLCQEC